MIARYLERKMKCIYTLLLPLLLLLRAVDRGACTGSCSASILEGPAELLEVTTGGNAVFSCTALGNDDPRKSSRGPCDQLFDDGRLNPVTLFWEIDGLGLQFSTQDNNNNRPLRVMIDGTERQRTPLELQNEISLRGLDISSDCPRIDFDDYRRASEGRLSTEPPDFCLSELSCSSTISIPANRMTNGTAVRCGVYSRECNGGNVMELENDHIFYSSTDVLTSPGRLFVRESLLSVFVYQNSTTEDEVCFECTFTMDSTASGCQITFSVQERNNTVLNATNVDGMATGCVDSLSDGNYTVAAVEIDADGVLGTQEIVQAFEVFSFEESSNATATINVVVVALSVAGNVLTAVTLLIVIILCCVLVRRKDREPKGQVPRPPPADIGYTNHSSNVMPPSEALYSAPSTHEYDYPAIVQSSSLETSEEYDTYYVDNTQPTYVNGRNTRQEHHYENRQYPHEPHYENGHNTDNRHSYVNTRKSKHKNGSVPTYVNGHVNTHEVSEYLNVSDSQRASDPSYLVILPDHYDSASTYYTAGTDAIATMKCIAYDSHEEDKDRI